MIVLEELKDNIQILLQKSESERQKACRLFHGRGHCFEGFEGLNIDWYAPTILITAYQLLSDEQLDRIVNMLQSYAVDLSKESGINILLQQRGRQRSARMTALVGQTEQDCYALEDNLRFKLDLSGRQNIGYFMDMSPGREWLSAKAKDKRVLNLFAYTCAIGVAAESAGAAVVVNVDMSKAALKEGQANHAINAIDGTRARFWPYDIMRNIPKLIRSGPYDLIVIDPPTHQRGSFEAEKHYPKLIRRLDEMCATGGEVLACLNAPEYDEEFLSQIFALEAPEFEFVERLQNRTDFKESDENRNLKMLVYRRRENNSAA